MAYEPTVWQAGDTITSARLNKLEQGVAAGGGAGGMVANVAYEYDETTGRETYTVTDATAGEIWDAMAAGANVVLAMSGSEGDSLSLILQVDVSQTGYYFHNNLVSLFAETASGYPSYEEGGGVEMAQ